MSMRTCTHVASSRSCGPGGAKRKISRKLRAHRLTVLADMTLVVWGRIHLSSRHRFALDTVRATPSFLWSRVGDQRPASG